jgi:uncharacterized membrane protein
VVSFADPNLLFVVVLFLHIGGAIAAFGPTFAFSIIGAMGGAEPMHTNFSLRVTERIIHRLVEPLAIFQGITGVLLIVLRGWNVFALWLVVAIVLYAITLTFSLFYAVPTLHRLVEATSTPPPAPPPGSPPPSGPPPHIAALVQQVQRNGMLQGIILVAIVLLMVFKPTL